MDIKLFEICNFHAQHRINSKRDNIYIRENAVEKKLLSLKKK